VTRPDRSGARRYADRPKARAFCGGLTLPPFQYRGTGSHGRVLKSVWFSVVIDWLSGIDRATSRRFMCLTIPLPIPPINPRPYPRFELRIDLR